MPIGVPGFRLTEHAVAYLDAVAEAGGRVVCLNRDSRNRTRVLVLPTDLEDRWIDQAYSGDDLS